jgi:hypothetical protein
MAGGPQRLARVLVVDDDRLSLEMTRDALGAELRVECVRSAEAEPSRRSSASPPTWCSPI